MRKTNWMRKLRSNPPIGAGKAETRTSQLEVFLESGCGNTAASAPLLALVICAGLAAALAQSPAQKPVAQQSLPPRVAEAQRFLAQRGWLPGRRIAPRASGQRTARPQQQLNSANPLDGTKPSTTPTWTALGPSAVQTSTFGLVTGRISAIALDPSDPTGNHLYVGTTGGGVWVSSDANASTLSAIALTPLTDQLSTLGGAQDSSISIGALSVQPGGTGVILAGTGDPNDLLDSYYGAGILRSTDWGTTWSLIPATADQEDGLSLQDYGFTGEGFAGFAWSTSNPQLVVAAVSQAYEATLVDAVRSAYSYEGLYYSSDSGASWHLAIITDGSGGDVQGPLDPFATPDGNAATAVVWNQQRGLFIAAVRHHGFYQSPDGITWTRMAAQPGTSLTPPPGTGLTPQSCPTYPGSTGYYACPIFRGALAVNPSTGDTFAWYVDDNNQDQGLWQDVCSWNGTACANQTITFAQQWNTAALEANPLVADTTIPDGKYNLTLAAIPSQQQTLVFAGANDLWKSTCPYSQGCQWRNTTNSATCMSAQVAPYQHALAWNAANPLEMFIGNDSGLWRSTDAVGETGAACNPTDATHFQNLNGQFQNPDGTPGSLSEVESLSPIPTTPYTLMAGLGVNGVAGLKASALTADWPQILSGYGGPVAIDPRDSTKWYVNDQDIGVAIYLCSQSAPCTAADFGSSPVVTDADVGGDGATMPIPAPFLIDPLDSTQLIVGTCQVWRGPVNGSGWHTISNILDSGATGTCNGDALIRSMDAMALSGGNEIVYLGMYGSSTYGANLPGQVLSATFNPSSSAMPKWFDLTPLPTAGDNMNPYNFDISSVYIDPHDVSGNTVYVTVEGVSEPGEDVSEVYFSTNGGITWSDITANLPEAPANSVIVDPQNSDTVYVATDQGVFFTTEVENCAQSLSNCWSAFGTGLPQAPVIALSATPPTASAQVLVAGTYGRGIWQTPLFTAGVSLTAASVTPASLSFPSQVFQTQSSPLTVTLENTGSLPLVTTSITPTGDFTKTENCTTQTVAVGASCTINVTFAPGATGPLTGQLTIFANVYGGQITVDLNGIGSPAGAVTLSTTTLNLGDAEVGVLSPVTQSVGVINSSSAAIPITGIGITQPFSIAGNSTCGTTAFAANNTCQITVAFTPTSAGAVTGLLTLNDGAGTQVVQLSGTGQAAPTDILNPTTLAFPATGVGQVSPASTQTQITITNDGDLPLTGITVTPSAQFQASSNFVSQIPSHSQGVVTVQFAPTSTGPQTGTLTITDFTTQLHTQTVALSGNGLLSAAFTISPTSLTFSTSQPGVASTPQTVTVTNSGGAPMAGVQIQLTGPAANSYLLSNNTCNGMALNSGSSCTVDVSFTPAATGPIAATLAASSSTTNVTAASIQLNGAGQLATALSVSPTLVTFATATGVNQPSAPLTVTVTNSSQYAIASVALAASGSFTMSSQGTCASGIAAGGACTASIIFDPTVFGPATGTLTVSSPVVTTPATATLAGTGFDFTLAAPIPSSTTVTSGQQADYTLALTPEAAQGTFTFACGTLPANALCLFNPTTQTLASGVEGNVMVQIYTGSSGLTVRADPPSNWRVAPLLCGLLLLPFALIRRRKFLLLVVLSAILAGGVSSCTSSGGGTISGGQSSSSATPPGAYQIPVTVTSMGVSHTQTVTLTVD